MDKVVILARVSTDKQEYQRQLVELRAYCAKVGWEVVREFANKVSGARKMEERSEIVELIEFVQANDVRRVVCLEISRLGRNTLEALKVIQTLNEHKVSLFVKNYNLETLTPDGEGVYSFEMPASEVCSARVPEPMPSHRASMNLSAERWIRE